MSCGGSQTYTFTPDPGFVIVTVIADHQDVGAVTSYTFADVTAPHTIVGIFGQTAGVETLPQQFALSRPWPNPAYGRSTQIEFAVASEARVRLSIVDVTGRDVRTLAEGAFPPGRYHVTWDGRSGSDRAAPGVYFVRYSVPGREFVQRLVLAN